MTTPHAGAGTPCPGTRELSTALGRSTPSGCFAALRPAVTRPGARRFVKNRPGRRNGQPPSARPNKGITGGPKQRAGFREGPLPFRHPDARFDRNEWRPGALSRSHRCRHRAGDRAGGKIADGAAARPQQGRLALKSALCGLLQNCFDAFASNDVE